MGAKKVVGKKVASKSKRAGASRAAKKAPKKALKLSAKKGVKKVAKKAVKKVVKKPVKKATKSVKSVPKAKGKAAGKKGAKTGAKVTTSAQSKAKKPQIRTDEERKHPHVEVSVPMGFSTETTLVQRVSLLDDIDDEATEEVTATDTFSDTGESTDEQLDETSDPMPAVGEAAPVFETRDQDGVRRNLTDFQGRWVLLYFYSKDGTSGCTKEACGLRDVFPEFEKLDAVVLGVSVDSVESHFDFAEEHALPFTLLSDTSHKIVKQYGVWQKKSYMGREYMGTLRTSFLINPDGRIARVYEHVDPESHAEEVLEDLQDLAGIEPLEADN